MLDATIHYELQMTHRQHEELQTKAALWHLARQSTTGGHRLARPRWFQTSLAVLALALRCAADRF